MPHCKVDITGITQHVIQNYVLHCLGVTLHVIASNVACYSQWVDQNTSRSTVWRPTPCTRLSLLVWRQRTS